MRPRAAAFGLWAALTFSCAVVVHGVIHAAGTQAFVWDSPAHVVMLAAALGLLLAVAGPLGLVGSARERRRRLALVRAQLAGAGVRTAAVGLFTQAGIAGLLLAAEGAAVEPGRLATALACGLVALLCSALLFRATRDRVVALLAAFTAVLDQATAPPPVRRLALRPARATVPYRLFVPNRPPPR
ncbi:MAG TPA: hypothetical protein VE826_01245 [Dongiaceae bacterium]|nr:hypothetical protein [Dongiaceae bacterium]